MTFRITGLFVAALCAAAALGGAAKAAEPAPVRVAVLKFGTVNWLIDSVVSNAHDRANGVAVEMRPLAGKDATAIALQSGDVDMIVTDWPWAMRQRADGADFKFAPYSNALGAVIAGKDSGVADVCALKGRKIGVVGGPLDKSWLLLQAYAQEKCGFDIAAEAEPAFGAPPLMNEQLTSGAVAAVVTYWHYAARLEAAGNPQIISVNEIMTALGVTPPPPLIGFVWKEAAFRDRQAALDGFLAAVHAANATIRASDPEWDRLRPLMRADDDGEFRAVRDRFREGVLDQWTPAYTGAGQKLHEALIRSGGEKYMGEAGAFDAGVFYAPQP